MARLSSSYAVRFQHGTRTGRIVGAPSLRWRRLGIPQVASLRTFRAYSGFDSALCGNREAEWLLLQEEAPLHDACDFNK